MMRCSPYSATYLFRNSPIAPLLHLFQFLCLNPTITGLVIIPTHFTAALSPTRMPRLETFRGPGTVACSVLPGSRISKLMIYWELFPDFSRVLAMAGTSKIDVVELSSVLDFWDPLLLMAVAKHVPRVELLHIQYIENQHGSQQDDSSAVENTLHSLPGLAKVRIMEGDGTRMDSTDGELDSEFEVVRKWGETFPNFNGATFMTARLGPAWVIHSSAAMCGIPESPLVL
ncbi:hypothetical protein C8R47DRAFT_1213691 [Mycena vitilis]|nr:hypothetical protein C8R47DRAFT_1213691 [Mycena vitilis]